MHRRPLIIGLLVTVAAAVGLVAILRGGGPSLKPAPAVDVAGLPGQPPCAARENTSPITPSPAPVNTTALGDRAPAPYELGAPTTGTRPHGVMMVVHGGAWTLAGPPMLSQARPEADQWRNLGWATANVDYRVCGFSLQDTLLQYDLVRDKVGEDTPICLDGESAGGHLALMVAALRPDVACVLARAAPTDGETLGQQDVTDAVTGKPSRAGSQQLATDMARAFGQGAIRAYSPVNYAKDFKARLLLVTVANDSLVPPAQATELADRVTAANPGTYMKVLAMAAGPTVWVHGGTTTAELSKLAGAEIELVSPWASGDTDAPEHVEGWW
jgi:acetyl esterase/lipase